MDYGLPAAALSKTFVRVSHNAPDLFRRKIGYCLSSNRRALPYLSTYLHIWLYARWSPENAREYLVEKSRSCASRGEINKPHNPIPRTWRRFASSAAQRRLRIPTAARAAFHNSANYALSRWSLVPCAINKGAPDFSVSLGSSLWGIFLVNGREEFVRECMRKMEGLVGQN